MTSAERVVLRPPRPLVLGQRPQQGGLLAQKPMGRKSADDAMKELIGVIANSPTPVQLDPKTAEILSKVLGSHAGHP